MKKQRVSPCPCNCMQINSYTWSHANTYQINTSSKFPWWEKTFSETIEIKKIYFYKALSKHSLLVFKLFSELHYCIAMVGSVFGPCLSVLLANLFKKDLLVLLRAAGYKTSLSCWSESCFLWTCVSVSRGKANRICLRQLLLSNYVGEHCVENPDRGFFFCSILYPF